MDNAGYNRKRTYQEGFQADQEARGAYYNRPFKTPRRGRGGGRGDWMSTDGHNVGQLAPPSTSDLPVMPPAFPAFNQSDPMSAMMALQGMGFPQMPAMPPLPIPPATAIPEQAGKVLQRCPFYDTQGICYLGATCPYQHGPEPAAANDDGKKCFIRRTKIHYCRARC